MNAKNRQTYKNSRIVKLSFCLFLTQNYTFTVRWVGWVVREGEAKAKVNSVVNKLKVELGNNQYADTSGHTAHLFTDRENTVVL